jgi:phosphatidylglycerol:prolipoprotein diacylglycerol transferase
VNPLAQFVHRIDPMLTGLGPVQLWYYGLAYCVGFVGVHLWFRWRRSRTGLSLKQAYDLTLLFMLCVLVFGRAFEIVVYEWDYYSAHLAEVLSFWRGGMASHGVLIGSAAGIWLFCRKERLSFLQVADEIVIPGAFFLALGRLGNFVNGQIYGSVTNGWWGVQFPDTDVFRHPVTLYESFKNLTLIPILLTVRWRWPHGKGVLLAHFVFWYGFLRIFTDLVREYPRELLGIGTGQYPNILMAVIGLLLILGRHRASRHLTSAVQVAATAAGARPLLIPPPKADSPGTESLALRRIVFAGLLFLSLTIPSGWTRGVLDELRNDPPAAVKDARIPLCPTWGAGSLDT